MFRKVAIALIAASVLTAPVMAQVPASKPAATTSSAVKSVKTVKADKTTLKHRKHARARHGNRMAQHKHMNGTKHARHFNGGDGGKGHKVAGATGKVASAKPATRPN